MEMEKRLILAIVLSIAIYGLFYWLMPQPEPPLVEPQRVEETSEGVEGERPPRLRSEAPGDESAEPAAETEPEAALPPLTADAEQEIRIDNGVFEVELTNRGGRARTWTLKHFRTPSGDPLQLFPDYPESDALPLALSLDDPALTDELNDALYQVRREDVPRTDTTAAGERLVFEWSDGRGVVATKSFLFRDGSYIVEAHVDVVDRGRRKVARLSWGPGFAAQESSDGQTNYYYKNQAIWNIGGSVTRTKPRKLDGATPPPGRLLWAGLEDQYFAALTVPLGDRADMRWSVSELTPSPNGVPTLDKPEPEDALVLAVSVPEAGALLFVGPKKFTLMRAEGHDLQKAVWFSSYDLLRPIVKYLFLGLIWLHDRVTGNWGLAIVFATLILRLVLFPVNQYSMVAMKRSQLQMQRLQPKVKSIRNKYKKAKDAQSRAKMNQEMMDLYRKEGVNPMAGLTGCLPLLAQFPILIGFYNMLTVAVELRGAPFFGWIQDLSQADPYWITPIGMAVTMFAQQKLAMTKIKDPQQLQQQRIMLFMPVMFGFICLQMPSGLVLYWFMNNLLGIGQQWLVNRHTAGFEAAPEKA